MNTILVQCVTHSGAPCVNAKDDECAIRDIECATETVGDSEITKEVEESENEMDFVSDLPRRQLFWEGN